MSTINSNLFWQDRRVFVTGATGLLGSTLVACLLQRGARVTALIRDHVSKSRLWSTHMSDQITCVYGSLTDPHLLQRALAEHEAQTVIHLGAQTLVGIAKQDPVGTLESNVRGTWLLLEAARQVNVQQVLIASSDKAYGATDTLPYREDHPLRGQYPYDVSKSCTDLISKMYAATFGLPVSIVRCGNLFGGGDLNYSRIVPGVIQAALHGEPFVIRSDGKFVRDFLYVEDAALAYLILAEAMESNPAIYGEAFNFSLGLPLTTLELAGLIVKLMGCSNLQPIVQNNVSTEIREQYLDATKARTWLSWAPRYRLEEGLERTIAWYRSDFEASSKAKSQRDGNRAPCNGRPPRQRNRINSC